MNTDAYRDLQLLTEISSSDSVTQRSLAKRHRLALGLTNFLLRRLVKKGYVKVVNLQRNRLRYLITPQGFAEKARLTYEYLDYSLYFYRQIRALMGRALSLITQSGRMQTVLYGTGEVAEAAFLMMQRHNIPVMAVIGDESDAPPAFLGQPVRPLQDLAKLSFDWVVVASLKDPDTATQRLRRAGVPAERILAVPDGGLNPRPEAILASAPEAAGSLPQ